MPTHPPANAGDDPASVQPRTDAGNHDPGYALTVLTFAYAIMSCTDAAAKYLTAEMSPGQITAGRYVFQTLLALPLVVMATGWGSLVPKKLFLNALRGVLAAVGSATFFIPLTVMPLADCVAIFFIQPFLLTILSIIFDREKVGWRRWSAMVIGFGGALLVIRPSFAQFGFYALLPAASAACFALFMYLNRRLRDTGGPMSLQVFASLAALATAAIMLGFGHSAGMREFAVTVPTGKQWAILAGIGGVAALGHYMMIVAFRYATPAVLAPTQYVQIIAATIIGYVLFGDFPDAGKWLGIAIIIGCGIYVFHRETRLKAGA